MLTQKDVSLKELNLLLKKFELMSANGKSIVSIDNPIYSEENEMDLTLTKEKLTCLRRGHVAK